MCISNKTNTDLVDKIGIGEQKKNNNSFSDPDMTH